MIAPFQVYWDGVVYIVGETVALPADAANRYNLAGWGPTHPVDHRVKVTRGLLERRNAGTLQSPFTLPARPGHLGSLSDSSRAAEVRPQPANPSWGQNSH